MCGFPCVTLHAHCTQETGLWLASTHTATDSGRRSTPPVAPWPHEVALIDCYLQRYRNRLSRRCTARLAGYSPPTRIPWVERTLLPWTPEGVPTAGRDPSGPVVLERVEVESMGDICLDGRAFSITANVWRQRAERNGSDVRTDSWERRTRRLERFNPLRGERVCP